MMLKKSQPVNQSPVQRQYVEKIIHLFLIFTLVKLQESIIIIIIIIIIYTVHIHTQYNNYKSILNKNQYYS